MKITPMKTMVSLFPLQFFLQSQVSLAAPEQERKGNVLEKRNGRGIRETERKRNPREGKEEKLERRKEGLNRRKGSGGKKD